MSVIGDILMTFVYEPFDEFTKEEIDKAIHAACPGDYRVETTETERGFSSILYFTDPEEATIFKVKGWM